MPFLRGARKTRHGVGSDSIVTKGQKKKFPVEGDRHSLLAVWSRTSPAERFPTQRNERKHVQPVDLV